MRRQYVPERFGLGRFGPAWDARGRRRARPDGARRSVSRVLSPTEAGGWPFIWDARCRTPLATYPGGGPETCLPDTCRRAAPTWSCSRWGLPCRPRYRDRGALLPHPFTLTLLRQGFGGRFAFCGTFPGVAPAGCYPAPCFHGARTFLPPPRRRAAIRPSGATYLVSRGRPHGQPAP